MSLDRKPAKGTRFLGRGRKCTKLEKTNTVVEIGRVYVIISLFSRLYVYTNSVISIDYTQSFEVNLFDFILVWAIKWKCVTARIVSKQFQHSSLWYGREV